jgi:predicted ATP-grasp superfamily ATP-dependent carboligase
VPGQLLADAHYYGTLAAVRDLGRSGVPVALAAHVPHSNAAASRHCGRVWASPPTRAMAPFLQWLIDVGQREPGLVLHPTSDDLAWLMAAHHDRLAPHFRLFQPPASAVYALLDKAQLYAHAAAAGVPTPGQFAPTTADEVQALGHQLAREGGFPVIVKPRTQCGMTNNVKGLIAHTPAELVQHVRQFQVAFPYEDAFLALAPADIRWPLVQTYLPDAQQHTCSVSGFVDAIGRLQAVRASVKVFQKPVKIGIGIAFEGLAVPPELARHVQALATATGFVGAFEAEFIHVQATGERLLMDFNPRFYGQMHFDICRGMALPRMVHASACGDAAGLQRLIDTARSTQLEQGAERQRYCNRWMFNTLLWAQRAKGALSAERHAHWRRWMNEGELFDFVADPKDPAPYRNDQFNYLRHWARHPRASFRQLFQ